MMQEQLVFGYPDGEGHLSTWSELELVRAVLLTACCGCFNAAYFDKAEKNYSKATLKTYLKVLTETASSESAELSICSEQFDLTSFSKQCIDLGLSHSRRYASVSRVECLASKAGL